MRKIIFLVLVVLLVGGVSGCVDKRVTRVTDELDQCIGKKSSCVTSIHFEPSYDYKQSIYLWDFEKETFLPDGGKYVFYKLKSQLASYGNSYKKTKFRKEYMKVLIDSDDVVTGYERVYEIE